MAARGTLVREPTVVGGVAGGGEYPSSDGLALLGTSWHEVAVILGREALDRHFRGRDDLFIATLMALYYERRGRRRCLIPDLLVARGVPSHGRRVYKVWEEGGVVPQFVLEVASRTTRDRDCGFKQGEYQQLGVREYWQLDQTGRLLEAPLVGHRLRGGRYERVRAHREVAGSRQYRSAVLGLLLRAEWYRGGLTVVFSDPHTGVDIPTGEEIDRALQAEGERAEAADERAEAADERAEAQTERARREKQGRLAAEKRLARAEEALRRARAQAAKPKHI